MGEVIAVDFNIVKGADTPDDVRDLAFDVWSTVALQNYAETARKTGINEHTLRSWGRRDGWRAKALHGRLDVAPEELRHAVGSILQAAAIEGAQYLYNVASGAVEPNRARQQACIAVCHMAGWAPAHYLPGSEPKPKPKRDLPDLDTMSPDELSNLEHQLITGTYGSSA